MAVITLQVFGKYVLRPSDLVPMHDYEMKVKDYLVRTYDTIKGKVLFDNNLGG